MLLTVAGLLGVLLVVMVLSSVYALRQVTRNVESLIGDSMVGLESSVSMRATVRETQLDLLRLQLARDRRLPAAEVATFKIKIAGQLRDYRRGVFEAEDERNAEQIEARLESYLVALQPIVDARQPDVAALKAADEAARELVDAVETAYQFNRHRIRATADEAAGAARQTLAISNRLWWGLAIFSGFVVLIYIAFRWLAVPVESD